ncbi:MAG: HupE/UreJ family protein, partial [Acetobacteraceae bacterium]
MNISCWIATGLLLGCALVSAPAFAHKESDAFLTLTANRADPHALEGQWDISLRDLDFALGIDSNHDGKITWGEVRAHRKAIEDYALARLAIKGDGLTCAMQPRGQEIDDHTDGAYGVILFRATCDKEIPARLTVDYRLFYNLDPFHRGIVTIHANGITTGTVLGPEKPQTTLDLRKPDRWQEFRSFVIDGIWHIWTGIDHLLFIISLLLPAVMMRRRTDDPDGRRAGWG